VVINSIKLRRLRVDELSWFSLRSVYRWTPHKVSSLLMLGRWFAHGSRDMIILSLCAVHGRSANDCGLDAPASLEIIAKAGSMVETSSVFTDQQNRSSIRSCANRTPPDKYPSHLSQSSVTGKLRALIIRLKSRRLTLHGVTRQITIPTLPSRQ